MYKLAIKENLDWKFKKLKKKDREMLMPRQARLDAPGVLQHVMLAL